MVPATRRTRILIRVDGAGATHELTKHLAGLNTSVIVVLIGAERAWA